MPEVPSLVAPRVTPNVSGATIPDTTSPEEIAGRQNQQLGAAMMDVGSASRGIALDMQQQVDQVQVNSALNQARRRINDLTYDPQIGYRAQRGEQALTRASGQALPEEYDAKLKAALADISDTTLKTDNQRRLFQQHASDLSAQFYGAVEGHMLQEFTNNRVSVADGATDLAVEDAKLNWNDPKKVRESIAAAKGGIYDKAKALGWSAGQADAAMLKVESNVHKTAIMSALANDNPEYAFGYLNKFKGGMTGEDLLAVQGHINQAIGIQLSTQAVSETTLAMQPQILPNSFDKMVHITGINESGGRQIDPKTGGPVIGWVTKPDGSKVEGGLGFMQVTAKTGPDAAKLAGLPWDEAKLRTDSDYNQKLGRAYLQERLQKWGDPAKAWAAYNAGDSAVAKAISDAQKDRDTQAFRGAPDPRDWLLKMPRDTQAYVAKNMAALGSAAATPPRPTEGEFINEAVRRLPPGAPPHVVQMTKTAASQQFGVINKTLDEQGNNAVTAGQQWLAENGGQIDRMPPEIREQVLRLAPGKLDDLSTYAHAFDGSKVETNYALYNRLAAHPDVLTAMDDPTFEMLKSKLKPDDFKHFSDMRATLLNGKPTEKPTELNLPTVEATVSNRLRQLNIDPTPKDDGGNDAARVGTVRKLVHDQLYAMQQQHGKKFTEQETEQAIDKIFSTNTEVKHWLDFGSGRTSVPLLSMSAGDVPSDVSKRLKADFKKAGIDSPTDAQVLGAYQALVFRQRRMRTGGY